MKTREGFISEVIEAIKLAEKSTLHDNNALERDNGRAAFEKLHFDFPLVSKDEVESVTKGFLCREPWAMASNRFLLVVLEKICHLHALDRVEQATQDSSLVKALCRLYAVSIFRTIEVVLSGNEAQSRLALLGFQEIFTDSYGDSRHTEVVLDVVEKCKGPEEEESDGEEEAYEPFEIVDMTSPTICYKAGASFTSNHGKGEDMDLCVDDAAVSATLEHLISTLQRQVFTFADCGLLRDAQMLDALADCCETFRKKFSVSKKAQYTAISMTAFVRDCVVSDSGCLGVILKALLNGFGISAGSPAGQQIDPFAVQASTPVQMCLRTIGSICASFKHMPNPPNRQLWQIIHQYHLLDWAGACLEHSLQLKAMTDDEDQAVHATVLMIEFCAKHPPPNSLKQGVHELLMTSGSLRSLTLIFIWRGADASAVIIRQAMLFVCAASHQSYVWSKSVPGFQETWDAAVSLGQDVPTMLFHAMSISPERDGDAALAQFLRHLTVEIENQCVSATDKDKELDSVCGALASLERMLSLMAALQTSGMHGFPLWGPETRGTIRENVAKCLKECHALINIAGVACQKGEVGASSLKKDDGRKVERRDASGPANRAGGILRECSRLLKELQLEGIAIGKSD